MYIYITSRRQVFQLIAQRAIRLVKSAVFLEGAQSTFPRSPQLFGGLQCIAVFTFNVRVCA